MQARYRWKRLRSMSFEVVPRAGLVSNGPSFERRRSVRTISSSREARRVVGPGRTQATPLSRTGGALDASTRILTMGLPLNIDRSTIIDGRSIIFPLSRISVNARRTLSDVSTPAKASPASVTPMRRSPPPRPGKSFANAQIAARMSFVSFADCLNSRDDVSLAPRMSARSSFMLPS